MRLFRDSEQPAAFILLIFILLVRQLWEAMLALPYGWWDYQHPSLMGKFIATWSSLPIEAVCVWIALTQATAIVFEVAKRWQASSKPVRGAAGTEDIFPKHLTQHSFAEPAELLRPEPAVGIEFCDRALVRLAILRRRVWKQYHLAHNKPGPTTGTICVR